MIIKRAAVCISVAIFLSIFLSGCTVRTDSEFTGYNQAVFCKAQADYLGYEYCFEIEKTALGIYRFIFQSDEYNDELAVYINGSQTKISYGSYELMTETDDVPAASLCKIVSCVLDICEESPNEVNAEYSDDELNISGSSDYGNFQLVLQGEPLIPDSMSVPSSGLEVNFI